MIMGVVVAILGNTTVLPVEYGIDPRPGLRSFTAGPASEKKDSLDRATETDIHAVRL
jgi:hypothetical protein